METNNVFGVLDESNDAIKRTIANSNLDLLRVGLLQEGVYFLRRPSSDGLPVNLENLVAKTNSGQSCRTASPDKRHKHSFIDSLGSYANFAGLVLAQYHLAHTCNEHESVFIRTLKFMVALSYKSMKHLVLKNIIVPSKVRKALEVIYIYIYI